MVESHPEIALLCPVPLEHLKDGEELCRREGRVAFGSQAWELFERDLEGLRTGLPVEVYIYASHSPIVVRPVVSWRARYVAYVRSIGGMHPQEEKRRPRSTRPEDHSAHWKWAGFWEVENLRPLPSDEEIRISNLRSWKSESHFKRNFIPEGPLLIERPNTA
jgi:hypothetical protein